MQGKVCIVTGANSGIGRAMSLALARMGATLVMVCRDAKKGEEALNAVRTESKNTSVSLMLADLALQSSVRNLVGEIKEKYQKLHVLINNAGVYLTKRSVTEEGIERTFATNHLGPFLLTNLLLPVIKASAPARIINVSSSAHLRARMNFDDLQGEKHYNGFDAYSLSKLENILFTYELARRLEGSGVTVNCFHPGVVRTNLGRDGTGLLPLFFRTMGAFLLSPEQGAETGVYLATSKEVENVTGKYFAKKRVTNSSKESYDEDKARKLWKISEELTG